VSIDATSCQSGTIVPSPLDKHFQISFEFSVWGFLSTTNVFCL